MNHSPDNFSDSDWDGGNIAWNEHDWQQYLLKNEAETDQFARLYFANFERGDRLDVVAHQMRWDCNDWRNDEDDSLAGDEEETYTVHRHPVYMVTRALYRELARWTAAYLQTHAAAGLQAHALSESFHEGQFDACMGFSSLDIGEYTLAICHLKRAIGHINNSIGLLAELPFGGIEPRAKTLLFDLRDLYLRVIADCREENRRRTSGDSGEY